MQRVLLTGQSGLLGNCMQRIYEQELDAHLLSVCRNPIYSDYACTRNTYSMDLRNDSNVQHLIDSYDPDIIINTAALTDVDYCETHKEEAIQSNIIIVDNLIKNFKGLFIQISTDFIYDGTKGNYEEYDIPNPLNEYGRTKLAAEKIVANSKCKYIIIRTSFYGWNILPKKSFAELVIDKLNKNEVFNTFTNQYTSMIYTGTLAKIIHYLINFKQYGSFNIGCKVRISKYDLAKTIAEEFELDKSLIKGIEFTNDPNRAMRPLDTSLHSRRMLLDLKVPSVGIREGIRIMKRDKIKGIKYEMLF